MGTISMQLTVMMMMMSIICSVTSIIETNEIEAFHCGPFIFEEELGGIDASLTFITGTSADKIAIGIDVVFTNETTRNAAFPVSVFLDDEFVSLSWKRESDHKGKYDIVDWFRPPFEARTLCILGLNPQTLQPFTGTWLLFREFKVESHFSTDFSLAMSNELEETLSFAKAVEAPRKSRRLISLGRLNGVRELLQNVEEKESVAIPDGDEWTAVYFEFFRTEESSFNSDRVMTINIGTCEEDEECVWSIIADTLKSVENADEPWDLLNVEMASCPDIVIQRIINLAKPKVVRVVYPGAIPLGIDMKVSFDSRLEPLQRSAIESGGYGCSLSHLWSLVTPMGYDLWTCTRRRPHADSENMDYFSRLAQTRAAIFIQTSNTNFEFGSHSKALVTCTKPFYEPRCDGLNPTMVFYSQVTCHHIGLGFTKNKAETIDKLEKNIQMFLSVSLGGNTERRAVECRESSVLWEDILNSSSSEKEGELAWMFKASALVSSVIGTNPLSIRSIELDSQLYPDSLNQLIKKMEHLSSSLSNNNNNNNNHQDIIIYQPAVSSGFRIEFAHMGSTELFLGISTKTYDPNLLVEADTEVAVVVRLSGPAVAATAIILPEISSPEVAKFPSSLPPGRYIVEVIEQVRGNCTAIKDDYKPMYSEDKGVRHEIGVIEISGTKDDEDIPCETGQNIEGPGYWIKTREPNGTQCDLLSPYWRFVPSNCTPRRMCAFDAFQCLRTRQGPVVFIGDSHARDIYMESIFLWQKFGQMKETNHSGPRSWFEERTNIKHHNQTTYFLTRPAQPFSLIFAPYPIRAARALLQLRTEPGITTITDQWGLPGVFATNISLSNNSLVVIHVGLWELDIMQKPMESLRSEWRILATAMDAVIKDLPGIKFLLLTIPAVSLRTSHLFGLANLEMLQYFRRQYQGRSKNVSLFDYYQLFLADTDKVWSDCFHIGATCRECDRLGRPMLRAAMSIITSQICV